MTEQGPVTRALKLATSRRAVWVYVVAVAVVVILAKANILPGNSDPYTFLSITAIGILLISEVTNERMKSVEDRVSTQNSILNETNEMLRAGQKLHTLDQCMEDLKQRLSAVPQHTSVKIDHLGLDMSQAWEKVERLIGRLPEFQDLEYRLLVTAKPEIEVATGEDLFRNWFRDGSKMMVRILAHAKPIVERYRRRNATFLIDVRAYKHIPFVHGIRLVAPVQALYVSMGRWAGPDGSRYEWGGEEYQIIEGAGGNAAAQDLASVFAGSFEHFWHKATRGADIRSW